MSIRTATLTAIILILAAVTAYGQEGGRFGVGLVFGQPTGVAWKYRMEAPNAMDGIVGFGPNDRFRFQMDYLWMAYPFKEKNLAIHYGPGVAIGVVNSGSSPFYSGGGSGQAGFGIRGVVGLDYTIKNSPLDLFLEVAPLIVLAPSTGTGLDVGFGMRAYP